MWSSRVYTAKPIRAAAVPLVAISLITAVPVGTADDIRHASYAVTLAAAIDTSSSAVGIAESQLYFMTPEEVGVALDTMQSMGVTQLRMFVPWRAVEPAAGVYDWTGVDKVVDAAEDRGIAVLAAVTSTPTWASDVQTSAYGAPRNPDDFGTFMGALAQRYGAGSGDPESARISAYEIWNEPQSYVFWSPRPDPAAYTELLKSAYTAIKAVDPSGTVVGGVVTAGLSWGGININPVEFVDEMYASGAAGYFDALSYHPYNYDWKFGDGGGNPISAEGQLQSMRALMDQNGDAGKLIWTSEYGLPTSYVSPAQQADFIDDFMNTWSGLDDVGPMFIYSLVDQNSASNEIEDTWGLYRDDWTPKPAAEVVKAWIAEHGGQVPEEVPTTPAEPETPVDPSPAVPTPAEALQAWSQSVSAALANWAASVRAAMNPAATTTAATAEAPAAATASLTAARVAPATEEPSVATVATPEVADALRSRLVQQAEATPDTLQQRQRAASVDEPASAQEPAAPAPREPRRARSAPEGDSGTARPERPRAASPAPRAERRDEAGGSGERGDRPRAERSDRSDNRDADSPRPSPRGRDHRR